VTVFGRVNHLGAEPGTRPTQPEPALCGQARMSTRRSWWSKRAHRVIHQPVFVVLLVPGWRTS